MQDTRRSRRFRKPFPSLRAFFDQTGIRQADIAADLGISESYMSNIVSGKRTPSAKLLLDLSAATNVPAEAILRSVA